MKKDLIFAPVMLLVAIGLFLLGATGLTAHIILSVLGIAVLVVSAVATKKEWKTPALEVIMRVCYGIALISGVVIMKLHSIAAITVIHRAAAALFAFLLVVLFVQKLFAKKA